MHGVYTSIDHVETAILRERNLLNKKNYDGSQPCQSCHQLTTSLATAATDAATASVAAFASAEERVVCVWSFLTVCNNDLFR